MSPNLLSQKELTKLKKINFKMMNFYNLMMRGLTILIKQLFIMEQVIYCLKHLWLDLIFKKLSI
jgi:hypothetical protein